MDNLVTDKLCFRQNGRLKWNLPNRRLKGRKRVDIVLWTCCSDEIYYTQYSRITLRFHCCSFQRSLTQKKKKKKKKEKKRKKCEKCRGVQPRPSSVPTFASARRAAAQSAGTSTRPHAVSPTPHTVSHTHGTHTHGGTRRHCGTAYRWRKWKKVNNTENENESNNIHDTAVDKQTNKTNKQTKPRLKVRA